MERRFGGETGQSYDDELLMRVFSHHVGMYDAFQRELGNRLRQTFPSCVNWRVVEGGCGTGFSTMKILAVAPGVEVICVDNEPLMLEKAKARLAGDPRVSFSDTSVLDYLRTLPDGSVHAFATAFMLHNTPTDYRQPLLAEVHRVLTPGGIYLNADRCGRDDPVEYFVDLAAQIQTLATYLTLGRPDQYVLWFEHVLRDEGLRMRESVQRTLLESVGFDSVEIIGRWQTECLFGAWKSLE